jgi:hypothetical protein
MRNRFALLLFLLMPFSLLSAASGVSAVQDPLFPDPPFLPPSGHPRVYFMEKDLLRLRENVRKPQNAKPWGIHLKQLESPTDGRLTQPKNPKSGNSDTGVLVVVESLAFDAVLNGNAASGKRAIEVLRNYIDTVTYSKNDYNNTGQTVFTIGIVYDWCYPHLTPEDKAYFQEAMTRTAAKMEIGWPPVRQGAVVGHGPEAQLQRDIMSAAIAMYDERPEFYQIAAGRFFAEFIEPKQFMYPAQMHPQGCHYMSYRYKWEILGALIFDRMGLPEVFGPDQRYTMYWALYGRRPDGQLLRDGDTHINNEIPGEFYRSPGRSLVLAAGYFKDPWLKTGALQCSPGLAPHAPRTNQSQNAVEILVFNDPDVEPRPLSELPNTKYFPSPKGAMICRTNWDEGIDASTLLVEMKVNEWYFMNHQHLDAGAFQIYYKGALATDSGYYQSGLNDTDTPVNGGSSGYGSLYDVNYNKRSIAHNVMTVYDPAERFTTRRWGKFPMANDGGQRFPHLGLEVETHAEHIDPASGYEIGKVLGHGFGPDPLRPDYSYLKGDLKNAYSEKMLAYERSFMFLDLKDLRHPGALIVYDRVESAKPEFRKAWLLHGLELPVIDGNRTIFKDTRTGYNGKLTVDTLLPEPENTVITTVGGPGFEGFVDGVNHFVSIRPGGNNEGGGWRVEVSPKMPAQTDYFLNVLQVGDHTPDTPALSVVPILTETLAGVQIANRVVIFGRARDRCSGPVEFSVQGNGSYQMTVCDLESGIWAVEHNGQPLVEVEVDSQSGIAAFEGLLGDYRLIKKLLQ